MINRLEKINIQDLMLAKALDISEDEILEDSLFQMKNEMQNLAFQYESENIKITQKEADMLNKKLDEIIIELQCISEIDLSSDYIIDFNNYVNDGKPKRFCYESCEGYTAKL